MSDRNFGELLGDQWSRDHFVCVGLDPVLDKIPVSVRLLDGADNVKVVETIVGFNQAIVQMTRAYACAYKLNLAFYLAHGPEGLEALRATIAFIHYIASNVPVILDAKWGDIGKTNDQCVRTLDLLQANAVTVNPYVGQKALQSFLDRPEIGVFVLCCTSNPGAGEFQALSVNGEPLYRFVARRVASEWNKNGNCGLVVGATYPHELRQVRELVGDMPILIPGVGAQGGDVEKAVSAGKDSRGRGIIVNSSSGIVFASEGTDFAEAARRETLKLHDLISQCLSSKSAD